MRPGLGYNRGWVNGYWAGHNNNWWNNWGGFATGLAVGGLATWGLGSAIYDWGYTSYVNPYYTTPIVVQQPVLVDNTQPVADGSQVYDYSQPLNTEAPEPSEDEAAPAVALFDAARETFKNGDFSGALTQVNEALKTLPNDATLHEFRALCLFALGQYSEAATVLYAVLNVGPGWDWTTLISLYPNVEVYTAQVRALEEKVKASPDDPSLRFVLAYHYLTQGHDEAAASQYQKLVQLQPNDKLSAALLAQLTGGQAASASGDGQTPAPPANQPAALPAPTSLAQIQGTWTASPAQGVAISLTVADPDKFTWSVDQSGKKNAFDGQVSLANDILTLARQDGSALVGRVGMTGDGKMLFQAMGGGAGDPGLTFTRQ